MYEWCMHVHVFMCGCIYMWAHVHVGGRRVPWHVCAGQFPGVSFILLPLGSRDWAHVLSLGGTPLHMPSLRHSPAISLGVLNLGDLGCVLESSESTSSVAPIQGCALWE